MEENQYDLVSLRNLGTENGWDIFELDFIVKSKAVFDGEPYAKLAIRINVLNGNPSDVQNCTIGMRWSAIRDAKGKLFEKEQEFWTYTDFMKIPFTLNRENCEKLGKILVKEFLPGRMALLTSLQKATNEFSRQVA